MAKKDIEKLKEEISKLSFEQAIEELDEIISKLEAGEVPLAMSVDIYERGELLKSHCAKLLENAQQRINKLQLDSQGSIIGKTNLEEANNSYVSDDDVCT